MKKLFYLFMVAMCATMFSACSDDDKDPLEEGEEGKEGVITAIITPSDYDGFWGWITTFNEGEIITIDWGDGNVEEFMSFEYHDDRDEDGEDEIHYVVGNDEYYENEIRHEYPDSKPYIITIKGEIKSFSASCNLTSLDVSKCPALTDLGFEYTELTSLDVSKNTALTRLWCLDNNDLTSLDVSGCTALTELNCGDCNLTSLDVSGCTALTELNCYDNNLTSLDISKNTALTELYCSDNNLTSLDVSKNTELTWLDCDYNNLTSLDVSKNTALGHLDCSDNNLTSAALNQIFRDLPQGKTWTNKYGDTDQSTISIYHNPGSGTCDKSIAENKGWYVE